MTIDTEQRAQRAREAFATACERHGFSDQAKTIRKRREEAGDGFACVLDAMLVFADAERAGVKDLVKPWEDFHGDLPDFDHPMRCVFESGIQYAVELLAKELGVEDYEPCDGTEEFDGDLGGTLINIVKAAGSADEHGDYVHPRDLRALAFAASPQGEDKPIDMVLHCPKCGVQHLDQVSAGWDNPPHRSHLCHGCGCVWRPADVTTNGVLAIETKGRADNWPSPAPQGEIDGEAGEESQLAADIANQLAGYVDMGTPPELRAFLMQEANRAGALADRLASLRTPSPSETVSAIMSSLQAAHAALEHLAKTVPNCTPDQLPLAALYASSEASRLGAAIMLLSPSSPGGE